MPKQALNIIKSWFQKKDRPTEAQFNDTWDSFWHKDQSIPQTSIEGLDTTLQNLVTQDQLDNAGTFQNVDITGLVDLSVGVQCYGSAPELTKVADADYRINVLSGSSLCSIQVHGDNDNVDNSSEIKIRVTDVDGAVYRLALVAVIAKATNQAQFLQSFPVSYSLTAANEMTHTIGNLQLGASGYILIFQPSIINT